MKFHNTSSGYIALTTMLVIAAVVAMIGTTVTLLSIDEGQMSIGFLRGERALGFVEGCIADALLTLSNDSTIPATVITPQGTCTITDITTAGTEWEFVATGTLAQHQQRIRIRANRGSVVEIIRWSQE